jgi:hypothetical protein
MEGEEKKPPPPETEQVIELKKKIRDCFSVFDREGRNACDVREVGTIIRSLNVYPTEKQLQRWIHEIEEEEPTGFIVYEKVSVAVPKMFLLFALACCAVFEFYNEEAHSCGARALSPCSPSVRDLTYVHPCHCCTMRGQPLGCFALISRRDG